MKGSPFTYPCVLRDIAMVGMLSMCISAKCMTFLHDKA